MTIAISPLSTHMQRLRAATHPAHQRIEEALPLLDPQLTRAAYRGVLEALYGFYAGFEPRLLDAAGTHATDIELGRRGKLPLLLLDLRALGRSSADIEGLPRCLELPLLLTPSHAVGALYVLEGATLGGQIIERHLRAVLALEAGEGAAFFAGYGDQTSTMWKRFSAHVDRSTSLDGEALITSAIDTFEKLRSWLTGTAKS
jgi:heme oxygenase